MSRIDESKEFIPVRIAVLTVSDTRSLDEDRSGDTLVARIEGAGHFAHLEQPARTLESITGFFDGLD